MLDILNNQWLNTKEIKQLASVGETKAREIKKEYRRIFTIKLFFANWISTDRNGN